MTKRIACLALWLVPTIAHAQGPGDLSVTPARVVFEGRTRSAQVALINRGSKPATYRIGFIQMRMTENGEIEEIQPQGPGGPFADELIRFSPRQVTLEPEVAQTVRLLLRKPEGLAPGEYRSHLLFYAVPSEEQAQADIEGRQLAKGQIGIRLTPIYRVTIPVIVREGELQASASLADIALKQPEESNTNLSLAFRLQRTGERSLYGDITVTFIPKGREGVVVGQVQGLAVYTPNTSRNLVMELHPPAGVMLADGVLKLNFAERPSTPGPAQTEAEIALPHP